MADGGTVTVKVKPKLDLEAVAALPQDVIDALADRVLRTIVEWQLRGLR